MTMMQLLAEKHFERGRQFEIQERLDEAIEAYERAVALEPPAAGPYLALGRLRANRGDYQAALELFDTASARSDDSEIREWKAYVLGRLRRYGDAAAEYAVVLDEGDPTVRVNLGRMLLAAGRFDEAEAVLGASNEDDGRQLYAAVPRYREFAGQRLDDMRTTRYLFGRTVMLGTLGDGGLRPSAHRYLLLTPRHVAVTLCRLREMVDAFGWRFDAVAGSGPHHGPVARAVSELLQLPVVTPDEITAGASVLLASAVVKGSAEALALSGPLRSRGARVMHLALGLVPVGDPDDDEPALVGFAGRSAVAWYRVESYSRLVVDPGVTDGPWPGFSVGPAAIDPNAERVTADLLAACSERGGDPLTAAVVAWYTRHTQTRAHGWLAESEADG